MKLIDFVRRVDEDDIAFARELGLLARDPPACNFPGCARMMTEVVCRRFVNDGRVWRCPTHRGQRGGQQSIRAGSWFENSNLPVRDILLLAYEWAYETPVTSVTHKLGISKKTAIQHYAYFRDVCTHWLNRPGNQLVLGRNGGIVEIDESCFRAPKHHRGRPRLFWRIRY